MFAVIYEVQKHSTRESISASGHLLKHVVPIHSIYNNEYQYESIDKISLLTNLPFKKYPMVRSSNSLILIKSISHSQLV